MGNINVINNFLDNNIFYEFKKILMSENINWFWKNNMTGVKNNDSYYFSHCFYNHDKVQSDFFEPFVVPILKKLNCKKIIQIRANFMLKKEKVYQSCFHTDYPFDCTTAILYINNCNGYTILDKLKQTKVVSEENKMLIFNSQIEHAGVSQTDCERRIFVNFNYL
jgi:hypothetical protein